MRKTMAFILSSLMFLFSGKAWAQTETGQISGTVLDQQNSAVPNAKITIRNVGTGALRETASDDHGAFIVTNLLPVSTLNPPDLYAVHTKFIRKSVDIPGVSILRSNCPNLEVVVWQVNVWSFLRFLCSVCFA